MLFKLNWLNFWLIYFLYIEVSIYLQYSSNLVLIFHKEVFCPCCRNVCRHLSNFLKTARNQGTKFSHQKYTTMIYLPGVFCCQEGYTWLWKAFIVQMTETPFETKITAQNKLNDLAIGSNENGPFSMCFCHWKS